MNDMHRIYPIAGIVLLVAASSALLLFPSGVSDGSFSDNGTMIIDSPEDLDDIRNYLGMTNSGMTFEITEDISLSELITYSGWMPIGNDDDRESGFYGILNGNGHTITGLWIAGTECSGLFGAIGSGGMIRDLNVIIDSDKGGVKGDVIAGTIAGSNYGTIEGCTVRSSGNTGVSASVNIGGIAGYQSGGSIIDCRSYVNVNSTEGTSCVGGLVGLQENSGLIMDCSSHGIVFADEEVIVSGGPRRATAGLSPSSVYDGDKMGGLLGMQDGSSKVIDSYSTGEVNSIGTDDDVGGLVGRIYYSSLVSGCYSSGDLVVDGFNPFVGGLVGNEYMCLIEDSYSLSDIDVRGKYLHVGSLLGFLNRGDVRDCFAAGGISVDAADDEYVGGLIGYRYNGTIRSSFYDTDRIVTANGIGNEPSQDQYGRSSEELMALSTFNDQGWGVNYHNSKWGMYLSSDGNIGYGYPYLTSMENNVLISPAVETSYYKGSAFRDQPQWISDRDVEGIEPLMAYLDNGSNWVYPKDAGRYRIEIFEMNIDGLPYQISFADDVHFEILPANNSITINDEIVTYRDGTTPSHGDVSLGDPSSFFDGNILDLIENGRLNYAYIDEHGNEIELRSGLPAGTYSIILTGDLLNNYNMTFNGCLTVNPKHLEDRMVTGIIDQYHTGSGISQNVTVEYLLTPLEEGIDFNIEYSNNVNVGRGSVSIIGIGNFTGNMTREFRILPPLSLDDVIDAAARIPERITWNDIELVAHAYDLYTRFVSIQRAVVPASVTDVIYEAVSEIEAGGLNRVDEGVIVYGDIPWHVVMDANDMDKEWEYWNRMSDLVGSLMGDVEHDIVSAQRVSFIDLTDGHIWHPGGDFRISMDTPDSPLLGIAHISGDGAMMKDARVLSDISFRAHDSGVFVMIGDNDDDRWLIPLILAAGVTILLISYLMLARAINVRSGNDASPTKG